MLECHNVFILSLILEKNKTLIEFTYCYVDGCIVVSGLKLLMDWAGFTS